MVKCVILLVALLGSRPLFGQWAAGDLNFRYGYGYTGLPRIEGTSSNKIALPGYLSYAPTTWVDFRIESDTIRSIKAPASDRHTDVGDVTLASRFGFQTTTATRVEFDYRIKLPVASLDEGLGSGRYDHRLGLAIKHSFQNSAWSLEGDVFGFINGVKRTSNYATFTAYAGSATYAPTLGNQKISISNEVDGIPANNNLPTELYWIPSLSVPLNPNLFKGALSLAFAGRIGITPYTPAGGFAVTLRYRRNIPVLPTAVQ